MEISGINKDVYNAIINILEIKQEKRNVIAAQKYEEAARLRDSERQQIDKISKIYGLDNTKISDIENSITEYFLSKYGVDMKSSSVSEFKSAIRQSKIGEILDDGEELGS